MPTAKSKTVKKADVIMKQQCELAPFANNSHETEYTRMMHRYADLEKRERRLRKKQIAANWILFTGVALVIGCLIGTWYVCDTIQSLHI